MPKRKNPPTSNEAYYSLDPEMLKGLRMKIFKALSEIGTGHYEDIASAAGITPMQCWKRLSELMTDGLIHRTGERKLLSSKKYGLVWAPGAAPETTKKKERVMKGGSIADHSRKIQEIRNNSINQPTLF